MKKNTNAVFLSLALLVSVPAMAMEPAAPAAAQTEQQEPVLSKTELLKAKLASFATAAKTKASTAYTAAQTKAANAYTAACDFEYVENAKRAATNSKAYAQAHPYKIAGIT